MLSDHTHQDIARSSYADMLNDDERNRLYDDAIKLSVTYLVKSKKTNPDGNRYFKCCDIGTGSGLLSMMIVRSFKKLNYANFHVEAFEAFEPMAECAERVIERNDMSEHITVIPTRSDLYKSDERPQFDLLVAELLDTELIGEGCLEIYRHAVKNLCSPDCLFVPHCAHIYVEPVASNCLFSRHAIGELKFDLTPGVLARINIPDEIKNCPGMPEIDDMQVSALKEGEDFTRFTQPQMVFKFTFGNLDSLKLSNARTLTFPIEKRIDQPPVVIMWWDISMTHPAVSCDSSLELGVQHGMISLTRQKEHNWNILSCAPTWAREDWQLERDHFIRETYGREVWREHWIQGVYYFGSVPETRALVVGSQLETTTQPQLTIYAYHDTHSMWFDLKPCESKLPANCACDTHRKFSRSQLAFLSDPNQMTALIRSSLCERLPCGKQENALIVEGKIEFLRQEKALGDTIVPSVGGPKWEILFSLEPGASEANLVDLALTGDIPWANIMAKYLIVTPPEPVLNFKIKFTQVQFDNLNRIRTNISECEGFNLSDLDDMINCSSKHVDKELEAHYLWEYPCTRIDSADYTVFSSSVEPNPADDNDLAAKDEQREKINSGTYWRHFSLPMLEGRSRQKGWALVFWLELELASSRDPRSVELLSMGPKETCGKPKLGERIEWNRTCKQLVYFLHDHPMVTAPKPGCSSSSSDDHNKLSIHLDVGLDRRQLMVQRAVDYNTSPAPLKTKRRHETN